MSINQKLLNELGRDYFGKELPEQVRKALQEKYRDFPGEEDALETNLEILEESCRDDIEAVIKEEFDAKQQQIVSVLLSSIRDGKIRLKWNDMVDRDYEQMLKEDIYTMDGFLDWMHLQGKYCRFRDDYEKEHKEEYLTMEEFKKQYNDWA